MKLFDALKRDLKNKIAHAELRSGHFTSQNDKDMILFWMRVRGVYAKRLGELEEVEAVLRDLPDVLNRFSRVADRATDLDETDFTEVKVEMSHEDNQAYRHELGLPPTEPGKARTNTLLAMDSLRVKDWRNLRKLVLRLKGIVE